MALFGELRARARQGQELLAQLELSLVGMDLREVHRRRADERRDELVHRMLVELGRRPDLLQDAVPHHGDAVTHRHRLDLVVRDVHGCRAEALLDARDLRARLDAQLRVEVRERLVHQEGCRLAHDRAAERDALPLAAGQRSRLAVEEALEVEDLRCLLDPPLDLLLGGLQQLEAEGQVVVDGHVRIERVGL